MNEHFLRLFDYDQMASRLILTALRDQPPAGEPDRKLTLMMHLLQANHNWLLRVNGRSSDQSDLWPKPEWGAMESLLETNGDGWKTFLTAETDFFRPITYQNQSGATYTNVLADLLAHIINHGTHHRAQIGIYLKESGLEHIPITDYIAYLRLKGPSGGA
ncbi:MAG TPA: DinB family protein [Dinghuibacter sp.]|jgi:uncharacterized damage-inducible protein DinB|uniref:DinB family protein n=1 Tax=Dinghuibacter sp. TaxID=2024697 RepID=UPI002CB94FCC|nr:DinB family protein [Dinghuibacter sp.]HTJ10914.1 DinB family protein [Dinghuibacter sp.]